MASTSDNEVFTNVEHKGGKEIRFDPEKLAGLSAADREVLARDIAAAFLALPFAGREMYEKAIGAIEEAAKRHAE